MVKVAINGFGRVGRPVFRRIIEGKSALEVVAINDLGDAKTLAHLLKYDSVYGRCKISVKAGSNSLIIGEGQKAKQIKIYSEKDPSVLPWKKLGVDIVLECTGKYTDYEGAKKHIDAGAKKVVISAPSKNPEKVPSFVLGVNMDKFDIKKADVFDMASCTTNCLAPITKVLNDSFGIIRGFMSTIHAYTNDQNILDLGHKDLRRARAASLNIIPTSTGAAKAIGRVIPELEGKLDGMAYRVPVPTVSVIDLVCEVAKPTNAQAVNAAFKKASQQKNFEGILAVEEASLVSSDFIGNTYSSIVDAQLTMVNGTLVKVTGWYDNEYGYATRLADFCEFIGKKLSLKAGK